MIKINSDVAFSKNMTKSGLGVVARNQEGKPMKARVEIKASEPLIEETTAIRMGMVMA